MKQKVGCIYSLYDICKFFNLMKCIFLVNAVPLWVPAYVLYWATLKNKVLLLLLLMFPFLSMN